MNKDDAGYYHGDPTPDQLELIDDLIGEMGSVSLDWLYRTKEGWSANLDFWLVNRGRAEDLISTLEHMLNKKGTNEP